MQSHPDPRRVLAAALLVGLWFTGWAEARHTRLAADVNGDGKADLVAFGDNDVLVSLSTGSKFLSPQSWAKAYLSNQGWTPDKYVRTLGDVNGDGKADIVAFGYSEVKVSLSTGSKFEDPRTWINDFTKVKGWTVDTTIREVHDVNGDGKDDVIACKDGNVIVALSTGSAFEQPKTVNSKLYNPAGLAGDTNDIAFGDFNGDGKVDLFYFFSSSVSLYEQQASGAFKAAGSFSMGRGWRKSVTPRTVGDVDGDGKDEVVGFAGAGTVVAANNDGVEYWIKVYGLLAGGWRTQTNVRLVAAVNGDGADDIVGFGNETVFVSTSTKKAFNPASGWLVNLCQRQGWRVEAGQEAIVSIRNWTPEEAVVYRARPGQARVYYERLAPGTSIRRASFLVGDTYSFDQGGKTLKSFKISDQREQIYVVGGQDLPEEKLLPKDRSVDGGGLAPVTFANYTETPAKLYQIDFNGKETLVKTLAQNGKHHVPQALIGGLWRFVAERKDKWDEYYRVKPELSQNAEFWIGGRPIALFPEHYTVPKTVKPGQPPIGLMTKSEDPDNHEASFVWQIDRPIGTFVLTDVATAEDTKFGGQLTMLVPQGMPTGIIRNNSFPFSKIFRGETGAEVEFDYHGFISRRKLSNGATEFNVSLFDLADFKNRAYVGPDMDGDLKSGHFVGPFLEKLTTEISSPTRANWRNLEYWPRSANKDGGYSTANGISVDASLGFNGKTPTGSVGAGWSQTTTSSTSISDLEFTGRESKTGNPIFEWKMAQYYSDPTSNNSYTEPWNMVRKVAAQIAADGNSVYSAPNLAANPFKIVSAVNYKGQNPGGRDVEILVNYSVTYRTVFTNPRKFANGAEEFFKGFGFIFGLNPDMWSGQTFRTWGTTKHTYKFPVKVVIPARLLK